LYTKEDKGQISCTGLDSPCGFQEFEATRFQENRQTKVIMLSALRNGRLCHQEIFPVLISIGGAPKDYINEKFR